MIKNIVRAFAVSAVVLSFSTALADVHANTKDAEMMTKCQQAANKNTKECQEFMMQHQNKSAEKETTDAAKN